MPIMENNNKIWLVFTPLSRILGKVPLCEFCTYSQLSVNNCQLPKICSRVKNPKFLTLLKNCRPECKDLTLQNKLGRPRAHCKVRHSMCARYLGRSMWFIGIYQIPSILSWTITINHNQALFVCCMVLTQNLLVQQEVIINPWIHTLSDPL